MLWNPNLLQPVGNGKLQPSIIPTITFKAVCGTQTRHGGTVNKDQPCSQIIRLVAVGGGCMHEAIESDCRDEKRVRLAPKRSIWQKPGIGMAAISPVPLRETIRKRTLVPGNDTDKGKAIADSKINRRTSMNWKIGDRAIVLEAVNQELVGQVVTITSGLVDRSPSGSHYRHDVSVYMVDIPSIENPGYPAAFQPHKLGPIPETYDGNNASTWDQCEFKPAVPVEVE